MIFICILTVNAADAQIRRYQDTVLHPAQPVYNPYQFPNYYQNNSMFVNNSMQTNPPPNQKAGPFSGNGEYLDPTKNTPPVYNNTSGTTTIRSNMNTSTNNVIK